MLSRFAAIALLGLATSTAFASEVKEQVEAGSSATETQGPAYRGGVASPYATPEATPNTSPASRRPVAAAELDANGPAKAGDKRETVAAGADAGSSAAN